MWRSTVLLKPNSFIEYIWHNFIGGYQVKVAFSFQFFLSTHWLFGATSCALHISSVYFPQSTNGNCILPHHSTKVSLIRRNSIFYHKTPTVYNNHFKKVLGQDILYKGGIFFLENSIQNTLMLHLSGIEMAV